MGRRHKVFHPFLRSVHSCHVFGHGWSFLSRAECTTSGLTKHRLILLCLARTWSKIAPFVVYLLKSPHKVQVKQEAMFHFQSCQVTVCFFYTANLGNQAAAAAEMNIGAYREKVVESWTWIHQMFLSHSPAAIKRAASPALEICLSAILSLVHSHLFPLASRLWI